MNIQDVPNAFKDVDGGWSSPCACQRPRAARATVHAGRGRTAEQPPGLLSARVHQVELEPKVPINSSYTLKITSKNFVIRVGHGVLLRCGPIVDPLLFYS